MLASERDIIVGTDLAAISTNPTGWARWKGKRISACHLYQDREILEQSLSFQPKLVAIDAPLNFPEKKATRKAEREMCKKGYHVFPPRFRTMEKLTERAIKISKAIRRKGFDVIEVHPASTRKALNMPTKDWKMIQTILVSAGLEGDLRTRTLTEHEIDAVTAALTGYLHLQQKTELIGDEEEGYIVVPKKSDWRNLCL